MSVTIRILRGEGEDKPKDLLLDKATILIGRGENQDVRLTNTSVSRRHCVIQKREDMWFLIDESSRNGTQVNGQRVSERRQLRHGDVIELGEVVLRVGVDRPLKEDSKPLLALSMKALVNVVAAAIGVATLLAALAVGWFLWQSHEGVKKLTAPIAPTLDTQRTVDALQDYDRSKVVFSVFGKLIDAVPFDFTYYRTFPEWDLYDIWSTAIAGQQPRLFDGLDLDLPGGKRLLLTSYFFHRESYVVPDAIDPFGFLYLELEGWGGVGPRYGSAELGAVRQLDLPHYVRGVDIWPQFVEPREGGSYKGGQIVSLRGERLFDPAQGNPLGTPQVQKMLEPILGKPRWTKIPWEGRFFSFFYKGNRYAATVRGSANLMRRFGGVDALAEKYFDSIDITPAEDAPALPTKEALTAQLAKEKEYLDVMARREAMITGAGAIRYEDLMRVRDVLVQAQHFPESLPGEDAVKDLYFKVRNQTQRELEFCAKKAFEGRGRLPSEEGKRGLQGIRDFLAGYPPLTLNEGDPKYPEWAAYVGAASQREPYNKKG